MSDEAVIDLCTWLMLRLSALCLIAVALVAVAYIASGVVLGVLTVVEWVAERRD